MHRVFLAAYFDQHWDVRYIRQCGVYGDVGPREGRWCFERRGTFGVRLKICHCDNKDGCNVASSLLHRDNAVLTLFLALSVGWLVLCGKTFGHGWEKESRIDFGNVFSGWTEWKFLTDSFFYSNVIKIIKLPGFRLYFWWKLRSNNWVQIKGQNFSNWAAFTTCMAEQDSTVAIVFW